MRSAAQTPAGVPAFLHAVATALEGAAILRRADLIPLTRPVDAARSLRALNRWGPVAGAVYATSLARPAAVALVDERGPITYGDLHRRSNALARAWLADGLAGGTIAALCRNHRGLLDAMLAAGKIGARFVPLNTGFGAGALARVVADESVDALVFDEEFGGSLHLIPTRVPRYVAWTDDPASAGVLNQTLDDLIASTEDTDPPVAPQSGRPSIVLLTSGTTGGPRGARRRLDSPLAAALFLDRIRLPRWRPTYLAAPMFHATGFSQLVLGLALGSTLVVTRRFDPEKVLRAVHERECVALVVVPTMLRRLLALPARDFDAYGCDALRFVLVAGSSLSPKLGEEAIARFGGVLYNLYGSTEVTLASVATPADWRTAPGTVGHAPLGMTVRLYDADGIRLTAAGQIGRVFAGGELSVSAYTNGDERPVHDGLVDTGDIGHFDRNGLLFIDGRADDMIISGGENVYPGEVEDLLAARDDIVEAAVVGVPDEDFGQRLRAYVVPRQPTVGVDRDAAVAAVRDQLARHQVPREIVVVARLPRNATGKLLRNRLSELGMSSPDGPLK